MLVRNLDIEEMKDVYDHMGLPGFLETEGSLSAKDIRSSFGHSTLLLISPKKIRKTAFVSV